MTPRPRSPSPPSKTIHPPRSVAREDELGRLARYLEAALAGETGVAFVSGDAGSGKTMLLEAFATLAMTGHPDLLVAGGAAARVAASTPLRPCAGLQIRSSGI